MTTQVAFALDETIKKDLFKKFKMEWLSMKAFFTYCSKAFLDDQISVWLKFREIPQESYSPDIHQARLQGQKDLENGDAVDGKEFFKSLKV